MNRDILKVGLFGLLVITVCLSSWGLAKTISDQIYNNNSLHSLEKANIKAQLLIALIISSLTGICLLIHKSKR